MEEFDFIDGLVILMAVLTYCSFLYYKFKKGENYGRTKNLKLRK